MLKKETVKELELRAKEIYDKKKQCYDEVEIAYVPVVIARNKGVVGSIFQVDTSIIFNERNDNDD